MAYLWPGDPCSQLYIIDGPSGPLVRALIRRLAIDIWAPPIRLYRAPSWLVGRSAGRPVGRAGGLA